MSDSAVAKKRGRPAKNTVAESNSAKDAKKKKVVPEKAEKAEETGPVKRGRGRPSKSSVKKVTKKVEGRGRGRPKKSETKAAESSAEENDNDTDE